MAISVGRVSLRNGSDVGNTISVVPTTQRRSRACICPTGLCPRAFTSSVSSVLHPRLSSARYAFISPRCMHAAFRCAAGSQYSTARIDKPQSVSTNYRFCRSDMRTYICFRARSPAFEPTLQRPAIPFLIVLALRKALRQFKDFTRLGTFFLTDPVGVTEIRSGLRTFGPAYSGSQIIRPWIWTTDRGCGHWKATTPVKTPNTNVSPSG